MSEVTPKFYIKVKTSGDYYWMELTGAKTPEDAQRLADQDENLGEIGIVHNTEGIRAISKKNKEGKWE